MARSLLGGHGFRTPVIHPPLWGLRDAALTVPVLVHGPLVPVLLAPALALFGHGALDRIAWLGALGAIAAVIPLVRLGERCGDGAIGFAAALLWTLAPLTLNAVHHDVSLTIGAALALAAVERATRGDSRVAASVAAGIAIGLAALARPELLLAVPLLAPLSARRVAAYLLGALACLAPWWMHHALAVGQPLFNLSSYLVIGYWPPHPGISVMRDFSLPPDRFAAALASSWRALPAKWADFFPHALKRALLVPTAACGWLAALGAAFALFRPAATSGGAGDAGHSRFSHLTTFRMLALALIPIAVMTVTLYDDRYLTPLLPLWALAAARGARDLAMRAPEWARRPRAWIGALLLLIAPTVAPFARDQVTLARAHERALAQDRARLAEWRAADAAGGAPCLLFSDTPDFVAWTTGCSVVWVTEAEYRALPISPDASGLPVRSGDSARDAWFHSGEPGLTR